MLELFGERVFYMLEVKRNYTEVNFIGGLLLRKGHVETKYPGLNGPQLKQ